MRVLIADDQPEVRSALRLLLEQEPGVIVVGEAANAALLLAQLHRTTPDVVLLDWELPGLAVWELFPALRDYGDNPVVIAMSGRPEARQAALGAGADAFVSKGDPPEQVLRTLEQAWANGHRPALLGL
jgi:DNA-binding NarL/FixJ family response regulator